MLPATLVTLVTFLLDITNSSPVYNMQPAFITTNIGSTNGRNIRNLPCISRKNHDLSGVCMFAIDCLKANGTHLGTCIDRFYFGSCCHIEPIKEIGNSIESNIILDSREPPQRLQNKTSMMSSTSTQSPSLSSTSSSSTSSDSTKLSQQNKESSSSTTTIKSTTIRVSPHTTKTGSTTLSSATVKPSPATKPISQVFTKPFGEKLPQRSTTTSTTEVTTIAQKLQTFQIIDGALLEATTLKPLESGTTRRTNSTATKTSTAPTKTSTKAPGTTTRPRPGITAPSKPVRRPSKPVPTTSSKPTTRPTKPSKPASTRKPTQKPSKPVKVSSTTKRPPTTTIKSTSTRRTTATKPTRRVTKPSANTSAKPATTTPRRPQTTTEKTTRKPPVVLTKKPATSNSTTASAIVTQRPSTTRTTSTSTTSTRSPPVLTSTTSLPELVLLTSQTSSGTSMSITSSVTTSRPVLFENQVPKKNISQILESGTINTATNEVIESSGYLTIGNGTPTTLRPGTNMTENISTSSVFNTPNETSSVSASTSITSSTTTSTTLTLANTSTTRPVPEIITWTLDDTKNHTNVNMQNETIVVGNITEEWVPITTPDGWVLLPSVTPDTSSSTTKNETSPPSTLPPYSTPPSVEPLSTFISMVTLAPETPSTLSLIDVFLTTVSPDSASNVTSSSASVQESASSLTSLVTSIVTSTSEGEKGTTSMPSATEVTGNVTTMSGGEGNLGNMETSSVAIPTTELVTESKPVNMTDFTDVCGRRMWPEARIVGGEKSTFGKWPWQISLRQWRTSTYLHKCGAALLNENWAITAAHCVDNVPPSDLLLRLGEHDLSNESEPYLHEERRVQIVASHPQFDPRTFEYDLALLRFYEPVQFQPNILPVCVPIKEENFVGRTAYVTGWGRLYEDGPLPSILQEVSVPVINNSVCESMYRSAGYIEHIPHIFICAGWRRGGFDSCEGDSGGPMVIQREDKRFLLAGVISWGIGCAEPNQPGVYTRISEFRDWINQILQF